MAATNLQMDQLSNGPTFQAKVRASIFKKALAIIEDVLVNKNQNFSAAQQSRAKSLFGGMPLAQYYSALACSTNIIVSNLTVVGNEIVSDISDAALDSQVYTVVFQDLV